MPGKQAKKTLKKRKENQTYRKRAASNNKVFDETVEQNLESLKSSSMAGLKAAHAKFHETLDAVADSGFADLIESQIKLSVEKMGELRSIATIPSCLEEFGRKSKKVHAALSNINRLCVHAATDPTYVFICALHLDEGLKCVACMRAHTKSHTVIDEHGCDNCGDVNVHEIYPMSTFPMLGVIVEKDGITGPYPFPVYSTALGLCRTCKNAYQKHSKGHASL